MRLFAFVATLTSAAVVRGGELAYTPPPTPEVPGAGYLVGRMFLLTGLVVALCLGILWASRRAQRGGRPGTKSGDLEYVAALSLNPRCALHLMTAGGQTVVIGTDTAGLKAMIVLPGSFESALRSATAGL